VIKSEKEEVIKDLNGRFGKATSAIVAEFSKLNVATVTNLRKKLRDGGVEYKVLKNTLARRAAKGTSLEPLAKDFRGSVSVILGYGDVVAPAKILSEFIKDLETIKVKSGVVDGKLVDVAGVQALAKLPGLKELRGQLLGMINQPASKIVRTIAEPGAQLARVLQSRADQLGKQS
jgi:large subunit ribosomal protein L10